MTTALIGGTLPEIPDTPDEITAAWLTTVLDRDVASVDARPLGTGQMASCYRVAVEYSDESGPTALIAKLPSDDESTRATAARTYRTEVQFYLELAPRLPVPTPACHFAAANEDATSFCLLLEDASPAATVDQIAGCTPSQATDAAIAAAALHAGSWGDGSLDGLDWLLPRSADVNELIGLSLQSAVEGFVSRRQLTDRAVELLGWFAARFESWTSRTSPFALVHNDYRLDNLLFAPAGSDGPAVTVVDWQSLSVGLPLRDVAYLLGTGLLTDDRRTHERDIVDRYHGALLGHGVTGYSATDCWDDYRLAMFQGLFISLLGELIATPTERGAAMFTAMVERSVTAIDDLGSQELVP